MRKKISYIINSINNQNNHILIFRTLSLIMGLIAIGFAIFNLSPENDFKTILIVLLGFVLTLISMLIYFSLKFSRISNDSVELFKYKIDNKSLKVLL